LHPTHPRQTLLQLAASQEPPKILPQLANIVRLASSEPARPKMQLSPEQLAAMRPKSHISVTASQVSVPDVSVGEKVPGSINIPSVAQALPKPVLPVSPMSAPRAAQQRSVANPSVPDVAGRTAEINTLIALSATPAPVAPPPSIPAGNLSARVSISPDGQQPGGDAALAGASARPAQGGGGHGPEGIFISGGNDTNASPVSGLGSALRGIGPAHSLPRSHIAPGDSPMHAGSPEPGPKLDALTEKMLGAKKVYTLYVNMPNLTSASGSWILNFAELDDMEAGPYPKSGTSDLSGPVPLRKVDPKYPPQLRAGNVEGEVLLYAIIRKDGSVDSIQLVRGVEPILNANAMEALAQWKFQPAEKYGKPVDLEAVVHIPFRSRVRQF
jgi:TonB family protein